MITNAQPRVAMITNAQPRVAVMIMTARVLHPLVTAGARALRVTAVITVMVVIVVTRRAIIRQILVMNKKSRHRQLSAPKSKLTVCR
jgi:hypothetical protein